MIYRLTPVNDEVVTYRTFQLKKGIGNAVFINSTDIKIADALSDPKIHVKRYTQTVPARFTVTTI